MRQLIKSKQSWDAFAVELPAFCMALLVAELFYKFGSFTLECIAFIPTWYGLSLVFGWIKDAAAGALKKSR